MPLRCVEDRVSAGVDWLNENGPAEWWDRIDLEGLNILDGEVCVLGQTFRAKADETGYANGYMYVLRTHGEIASHPDYFGFCDTGDHGDAWNLEQEWTKTFDKIRAEVAA